MSNTFSAVSAFTHDSKCHHAKGIVRDFLLKNRTNEEVRIKVRCTYEMFIRIQQRLRRQCISRQCKVDMLMSYWEKMTLRIQKQATDLMDAEACNLCLKFIMVPTEVKQELFSEYINACRDLYAIAFLQWRLRFPRL
jgi:hypothetical protein